MARTGRSPSSTFISAALPSCTIPSLVSSPAFRAWIASRRPSIVSIFFPSTSVIMSSSLSPAFAAGLSGITVSNFTPCSSLNFLASASSSSAAITPSQPLGFSLRLRPLRNRGRDGDGDRRFDLGPPGNAQGQGQGKDVTRFHKTSGGCGSISRAPCGPGTPFSQRRRTLH